MADRNCDMKDVWEEFIVGLEEQELHMMSTEVDKVLQDIVQLTKRAKEKRTSVRTSNSFAIPTLHNILCNRKAIIRDGLEKEKDTFCKGQDTLQTDTLGSMRTSFVGQFMEETYEEANRQRGKLSLFSCYIALCDAD